MPVSDERRTLYDTTVTVHDARPGDAEVARLNREREAAARDYADAHMTPPDHAADLERIEDRQRYSS